MSKPSISPRPNQWQPQAVRKSLAPVIPLNAFDSGLVPAGAAPWTSASLQLFRRDPEGEERRWLDALAVVAVTVFVHVTVVDWYHNRPAPQPLPPKETQVEIQLVRPAPPPPP
ncbi:MAG: hypothetical protein FIA97_08275, partial [Methylococcaceae bacterium]|nr:hypothetical protein [Methylococcaceae bacterium]